jgi:formylglycine-generating enzyme required for sulfatase activity
VEDGKTYPACGFLHDVDYNIKVEDAGHPITRGLSDFAVHDETYNKCVYETDNHLLLSTDHPTADKPLAWVRNYAKSNVCYIQMGHGPEIYADANYRRLVSQAIEWCAGLQQGGETKQDEKATEDTIVNSIGMKLVYIPAGEFVMGSPINEAGRQGDEMQHAVKLTRPLRIGATEVTQAQWKAVMGVNRSNFAGDDLPAEKLSWKEAEAFCKKLSEKEGVVYRLPTEAEWEYACRAGATGAFSGTGNIDDMGWYASNSEARTHPVGTKKPNGWGLYDMHGNVSEWCSDIYGADYPEGPVADPAGPTEGKYRVIRGGSWNYFAAGCRCAARSSAPASYQFRHTGFRVVMEVTK